ncbi:MAG TPA: hypothetical protein ENJ24_00260, partial [Gammaproteobacteria bacterium]|nr:hypothetical protein [Gammaproteobacteria bacterium]
MFSIIVRGGIPAFSRPEKDGRDGRLFIGTGFYKSGRKIMLLTRQPNISASAAVCTPAASFDNAVCRRTHGSPSLEKQPVGDNKHGMSLRCGLWQGGKSFPASRALIRTMLVVLRPIYLVAGLPRKRYSLLTGLLVLIFAFLSGCASMDAVKKAAGIKDPTV